MKRSSYEERDDAFGQRILTLRTSIGLTQVGLANQLGVSRRSVAKWEADSTYPKVEHLKHFIELCVRASAFAAGWEEEEIRALWKAAHQKVLLDESWLSALLNRQSPLSALVPAEETSHAEEGSTSTPSQTSLALPSQPELGPLSTELSASKAPAASEARMNWGEALDVPSFYGRQRELATLSQWMVQQRCRVVSVLGMGGIGKSALVTSVMHQLAFHFQVVLWRSLRDAPSCESLLEDCLHVLAPQLVEVATADLQRRLNLLLEQLRQQRVLLVLDNLESLLQAGNVRGQFRSDYQDYALLLQAVAQREHQSCILLTSREKPTVLRPLEGYQLPVRSMRLTGLEPSACEQVLDNHELLGSLQERARLIDFYEGNPLALNIVAATIADLFGGEIAPFLAQDTLVFGSISDLLDEQWDRLSPLEQTLLYWLATMREPVTIEELQAALVAKLSVMQMLEALDGLRRRSLVERGQRTGSFTLQSVVLEYSTTHLVEEAADEIVVGRLARLVQHGLKITDKDYVRQTQTRLLVAPLLALLHSRYQAREEVEQHLLALLSQLRGQTEEAQGYAPANLLALLHEQRGHLRGLDLSQLSIRGAYLQGVEMQDTSLAGTRLRETVFTEAFDAPWSVTISQNGQYWAAGTMQGKVHVWREAGQVESLAWQAHTDTIIALAFSPDGRTLASGSWDRSIKLWEVESGALLWSGWLKGFNSLAFAPDGGLLANSGYDDEAVRLWDPRSGKLLQTLPHPAPVYAVTWSPDGSLLASGDFEGKIRLWQIPHTGPATCLLELSGHTNWVTGLAFAPDGRTLASASWDGTVKLWKVESLRLLHTLQGHTDQVNRVTWSPDGRILASCGYDKTIWLWDVEQGSYRAALSGHTATVWSLAFTHEGDRLLSSSEDGSLRVWDVASGQCVHVMQGYAVLFYDIDWSPDNTYLVSGSMDGLVIVWNVAAEMPHRVLREHSWVVFGVAWSPDGSLLASSGWDTRIRLWDPDSGACVQTLQDLDDPNTLFYGVRWSPDGHLLACGTNQHSVQVWDVTTRTRRWVGRMQSMYTDRLAWSPDGAWLASTTEIGSVNLWNASNGILLRQLAGHESRVLDVAWSPEGARLASCSGSRERGELFVWDVQSGECVRAFVGDPQVIYAVAWDPTGDLLVSGGSGGILRWWNVQSGECVRMREAHQAAIRSLKVSPDGQKLASCGDDGAIRIWDLRSGEPLHTLRLDRPYERMNIAGIRGLTEAQKSTLRALGAREEAMLSL